MPVAVFADVHGNIEALRKAIQDIELRQVGHVFCAGDLVGYGPFPNKVISLIRGKKIETVMGNYDDGIANMRITCGCVYPDAEAQKLGEQSILWTRKNTTEQNKEFLRNLPREIRFRLNRYRMLIVHGSPSRLNEYLHENVSEEYLSRLLEEYSCDVLVCGHTHIPYYKVLSGDRHVVNVGSVGKPKHGRPDAVYALLQVDGGLSVDFIEVPYDYEAAARAIEESDLPDEFADMIRKGRP